MSGLEDGAGMATWQSLCRACASGIHGGGCCGCMACRVTPEPVPLPETLTRDLVEIRGDVKIAIHEAASIVPRGFDGQREKREALAKVDRLLDEYLEALWLELRETD